MYDWEGRGEETSQSQQKTIKQWDKVNRKLIKQCCPKGTQNISNVSQTTHLAALGLIITGLQGAVGIGMEWQGVEFPGSETTALPRPWPQDNTGSAKHAAGFRQGIMSSPHIRAWGKPGSNTGYALSVGRLVSSCVVSCGLCRCMCMSPYRVGGWWLMLDVFPQLLSTFFFSLKIFILCIWVFCLNVV